jgi:diguanylate cyclase (GGDEF)-like protein/PAS domain S-box-containing protein
MEHIDHALMNDRVHSVLVVGNDPAAAAAIRDALAPPGDHPCSTLWARNLAAGVARLDEGGIDAIVLDLFLPDSQGIDSFDEMYLAARRVPIIVLEASDHEEIARLAVQRGAKDRVLKKHIDRRSFPSMLRHILECATVDEALFVERERAQVTLNSIGDGVISTDCEGRVTFLNRVAEKITGWSRDEACGRMLPEVFRIIDGDTREPAPNPMELTVRQNRTVGLPRNSVLVRRDGVESAIDDSIAPIHDQDGRITGAVMVFRDVSEARTMERKLSHLAQHDTLTGLPNRMLLNDRLDQAIALAQRHGTRVAVLFLDLDRFKNINDSLGHAIGDKVLQEVSKRLIASVRSSDSVSRRGGDEFVVVLSEVEDAQNAARHAEKIHAALSAPHVIAGHDLHVNGSIGISIFPDDGYDAETLIKCADTAMYDAKENARKTYQFFKPDMNVRAVERESLEAHLRRALERHEFVLHYQSKIDLDTGAISGAEALIRWLHPKRGLLRPAQFVPIAEDCGLIVPIGRWVLHEACRQARAWQAAGLPPVPVAVNISALEFRNRDFLVGVRAILMETGLEPHYLELELTESVLMQNVEFTAATLKVLKSMGVLLAIDDFGTGYSSLNYLRQFPIDTLKIDQTFVRYSTTDAAAAAIVTAASGLGRSLRQRVIAEGVETREQLAFLKSQFCDEGQGYHFGRPVIATEFALSLGSLLLPPFMSTQLTALSGR